MKRLAHCIFLIPALLMATHASAVDLEDTFAPYAKLLDGFLEEKHLDGGGLVSAFDYRAALDDETTERRLQQQDSRLSDFDPGTIESREQAIAFWNNAYNYFMIQKILTDPGDELVDSVWDYGGRYNPFRDNVFERELFDIGGEKYSLDKMEKGILLGDGFREKGWWDARVHFTVNCAAVGCPPLRQQLYTADNIDKLLAENTLAALNTRYHLRVEGETLYLTELFEWYEDDFVDTAGSVRAFIEAHADEKVVDEIEPTGRIRHIDYDWRLNKPDNFPEFE